MHVDIALYDASKNTALNWFRKNRDISRSISMIASFTMVPAIVVAYWIGEETNWHPDAVASIKRLQEFYDYSEILNKPPGSPV